MQLQQSINLSVYVTVRLLRQHRTTTWTVQQMNMLRTAARIVASRMGILTAATRMLRKLGNLDVAGLGRKVVGDPGKGARKMGEGYGVVGELGEQVG